MTLGISNRQRVLSRVFFYLGVVGIAWALGEMAPRPAGAASKDRELGIAPVFIASPVEPDAAANVATD